MTDRLPPIATHNMRLLGDSLLKNDMPDPTLAEGAGICRQGKQQHCDRDERAHDSSGWSVAPTPLRTGGVERLTIGGRAVVGRVTEGVCGLRPLGAGLGVVPIRHRRVAETI